jgi:hypothetical protein
MDGSIEAVSTGCRCGLMGIQTRATEVPPTIEDTPFKVLSKANELIRKMKMARIDEMVVG